METVVKVVDELPDIDVPDGIELKATKDEVELPEGAVCVTMKGKTYLYLKKESEAHKNYVKRVKK